MQSKRLFASSTSRAAFFKSPSSIAWIAFSTSRKAFFTSLSLLVARNVSRIVETLNNISNTDEAPLGIALGFALIDGNSLGDREGTPDTEGAPLGIKVKDVHQIPRELHLAGGVVYGNSMQRER